MTLHHSLALAFIFLAGQHATDPVSSSATDLVHVSNTSHFEISAPLNRVAPLFGAEAERCWAGKHWNPEFVYPRPAKDIQGAVFKVQHGQHTSLWVNTLFDLPGGRVQYVSLIDGILLTTLDITLTSTGNSHTKVDVVSTRTAVEAAANDDVRALGDDDRESGPATQKSIEKCLANKSN